MDSEVVAFFKYSSPLSVLNLCFWIFVAWENFQKGTCLEFNGQARNMLEEAFKYLDGKQRVVCKRTPEQQRANKLDLMNDMGESNINQSQ